MFQIFYTNLDRRIILTIAAIFLLRTEVKFLLFLLCLKVYKIIIIKSIGLVSCKHNIWLVYSTMVVGFVFAIDTAVEVVFVAVVGVGVGTVVEVVFVFVVGTVVVFVVVAVVEVGFVFVVDTAVEVELELVTAVVAVLVRPSSIVALLVH